MKTMLRFLSGVLFLGLLASCAPGLKLGPDGLRFEVPEADLQRQVDKAAGFPVKKSVSSLGKLQVDQAKLLLIPSDNSMGVSMPVKVETFLKNWSGRIAFSATPVYEKETGTVYLTNFTLREIQVPGLPAELGNLSAQAVTLLLHETVKRYDVYKLDGSKWGEGMAKLALKGIQVREGAVAFHLGL